MPIPELCSRGPGRGVAGRVLEVRVNNHPGVMSHVCGLFSRRAYNLDGIVCLPGGSGEQSRLWLMVNEDARLPQMVKDMEKLVDVLSVEEPAEGHQVFKMLQEWLDRK